MDIDQNSTGEFSGFSKHYTAIWLGTLVATFMVFLGASEVLIRLKVEPNDLLLKHASLMSSSRKTNAVFGDSHASLGFTGQAKFINLAFPGENLETISSKVDHYFADKSPGFVIFQLGPHQFSKRRNSESGLDYRTADWRPGSLRALSSWYRPRVLDFWMVLLREEDFQVNRRLQPDGAQTVEASLTGTDEAERRAQAEQTVLDQIPPAEPSESRAAYFAESTLHALIQRGAAVCLVTFPVSPDQVEISTNFPEVLATRRYIDTLADTLDIRRVDYWAAVDDFSEFTNCDHLNAKGAARLASRAVPDCGFDQPKSSSSERSSQSLRHQAS